MFEDLVACGRALANGDYSLRSKPTNPIDDEFRVGLSDDPLQYHDWPWLIRCSRETLTAFWSELEDAKTALGSSIEILPSADPAEQWKAKCLRLLIRLADSVQCTGNLDNDVRAFVSSGRLPAEWDKWLDELSELDGTWASVQLAGVPVEASEQELKGRQESGAEPEIPKSYLLSWREIVEALDLKPNEASRDQIRSLNEKYSGPITIGGRGKQPKATRENLLKWWNGLESRFEENQARDRDKQATVDTQYKHGRDETVVPDISGHVKKRRGK